MENKTEFARTLIKSIVCALDKIDRGNTWEERDYTNEKMEKLSHELVSLTMWRGGDENGIE